MPTYCVNDNAQANGDHEVHDLTPGACTHLPEPKDRKSLGWHTDCQGAAMTDVTFSRPQARGLQAPPGLIHLFR
jgi:hypothetical protein